MSLKDYYIEKAAGRSDSPQSPDNWALKYIDVGHARSILEAFDDDASGFVTVNEVNKFTRLRPRDWRYDLPSRAYRLICLSLLVFPTG